MSWRYGFVVVAAVALGILGWRWWPQSAVGQPAAASAPVAVVLDSVRVTPLEPVPTEELPGVVQTDRGRPVQMYRASGRAASAADDAAWAQFEQQRGLTLVGPRDEPCNCFGWVFTAGRYWLHGEEMVPILHDNGYNRVEQAQLGDLVVYFDDQLQIVHCGLVRALESGIPIVESRWGEKGRYRHRADDQPYSNRFIVMRSPRAGHVLAGLSAEEHRSPATQAGTH